MNKHQAAQEYAEKAIGGLMVRIVLDKKTIHNLRNLMPVSENWENSWTDIDDNRAVVVFDAATLFGLFSMAAKDETLDSLVMRLVREHPG